MDLSWLDEEELTICCSSSNGRLKVGVVIIRKSSAEGSWNDIDYIVIIVIEILMWYYSNRIHYVNAVI